MHYCDSEQIVVFFGFTTKLDKNMSFSQKCTNEATFVRLIHAVG